MTSHRVSSTTWFVLALGLIGCGDNISDPCAEQEAGTACTWLGLKGEAGFNGDGHHRLATQTNQVQDLLFLPDGTAWFTDFNNYLVRRVLPDETVESMVGWTDPPFPGDGPPGGPPPGGAPGPDWQLNHPTNLVLDNDGSVVLVAWHNHKMLSIDPGTGFVKVMCGRGAGFAGDGGPASSALFKQPVDATLDDAGNLYIVDQQNQRVRKIDTNDVITTIGGTGMRGYTGDGGPALTAQFAWSVGSNPNPSGGIAYGNGKLYVSDTDNNRIRAIDLASGMVNLVAGTGTAGYGGDDGAAVTAMLSAPRDLEIGPDGDLYFADTDNSRVRAINLTTGVIRTVVGNGDLGIDAVEALPATVTTLRRPFGVSFDGKGNLYVMDSLNDRIVKVAR